MLSSTPPSDEEIEVLFKQFDTSSGDGYLSFEELMARLKKGGKDVVVADEAIAIIARWTRTRTARLSCPSLSTCFISRPTRCPTACAL